jgi:hypothetical protein
MEKCPNTKNVVVFGKNQQEKSAILFNPRCKSWSCDYCSEIEKDYWIHQASRGVLLLQSEGHVFQFVTLTSRGYTTPNSSLYFFKQNWPKLRKRVCKHTKAWEPFTSQDWSYFLIPERHKSGVLHAHLLAGTFVSAKSIWKDWAWKSGFGYQVDVAQVESAGEVAHYVAKYLHKGMGAESWPKGFRRVRHSQNWPIANAQALAGWEWETYKNENTVWIEKNALIDMGWHVQDKREN